MTNDNVIALPVQRKPGRRRHPMPDAPLARMLSIAPHPATDDRLADYQSSIEEVTRGLLMAIRAVTALHRKYPNS